MQLCNLSKGWDVPAAGRQCIHTVDTWQRDAVHILPSAKPLRATISILMHINKGSSLLCEHVFHCDGELEIQLPLMRKGLYTSMVVVCSGDTHRLWDKRTWRRNPSSPQHDRLSAALLLSVRSRSDWKLLDILGPAWKHIECVRREQECVLLRN